MHIRDRIKELRRIPAALLRPNPKNWRTHPERQRDALSSILADIGYADALLARELPDGTLQLIDGHLRAEITLSSTVPVLVLDVTQEEADRILLTHDPIAAMAEADSRQLSELLRDCDPDNESIQQALANLVAESTSFSATAEILERAAVDVPEAYQVLVQCDDEPSQRDVYEKMQAEGYKCRLLTL